MLLQAAKPQTGGRDGALGIASSACQLGRARRDQMAGRPAKRKAVPTVVLGAGVEMQPSERRATAHKPLSQRAVRVAHTPCAGVHYYSDQRNLNEMGVLGCKR